jgi:hypothetical protein
MAGVRALEQRRAALLERCAEQRTGLAGATGPILGMARSVDEGARNIRRFATRPVGIVLGVAAVLLLARARPLRSAGKAIDFVSAAWRAGTLAMAVAGRLKARTAGSGDRIGPHPARGNLVGGSNVRQESQGRGVG